MYIWRMNAEKIKFDVPGMSVYHGSYRLQWRVDGRKRSVTLGRVDKVSKLDAEKMALEYRNGDRTLALSGANSANVTLLSVYQDLNDTVGAVKWKSSTSKKHRDLVYGWLQEFHYRPIAEITRQDIRRWYYSDRNKKRPTSTDNAYRTLQRIMRHAIDLELIEVSPCQLREGDRYPKNKRQSRINHEAADLGKFLMQLARGEPKQRKKTYETTRDFILLALLTGVRKTALGSLKWEHVDFTNRWLMISPDANKKRRGDNSFHQVPMARIVQTMLRVRYEKREELCKVLGGFSPRTYVFPDRFGKTFIKAPEATLQGICNAAGIPKVGFHDLRRTVAAFMPELSDDYVLRQQYLGHSVSDVHVQHYAGSQSLKRRRGFSQDVADFLSRSLYVEGADGVLRGTLELAADNRTPVDERWADENTLEWLLYGDDEQREAAMDRYIWAGSGDAMAALADDSVDDFDVIDGGFELQKRPAPEQT